MFIEALQENTIHSLNSTSLHDIFPIPTQFILIKQQLEIFRKYACVDRRSPTFTSESPNQISITFSVNSKVFYKVVAKVWFCQSFFAMRFSNILKHTFFFFNIKIFKHVREHIIIKGFPALFIFIFQYRQWWLITTFTLSSAGTFWPLWLHFFTAPFFSKFQETQIHCRLTESSFWEQFVSWILVNSII